MLILPAQGNLQYTGRIDFDNPQAPVLVYAASSIRLRFRGTKIAVRLSNHHSYWNNYMGYILDGKQEKFLLHEDEAENIYVLANELPDKEHELLLFKRQDSCHTVTFYGIELNDGAELFAPGERPERRMEVFGDSVSCGEVSEAIEYQGKEDPTHNGEYSNSWYSYSWMTARNLGAELHDTSQGGIALLDGTGWFHAPDFLGAESCYDKIQYNTELGETKTWDFKKYQPNLVVIALGQNDNHPVDYMAKNPECGEADLWRAHYEQFIKHLMELYPAAYFVLTTTILNHDKSWDEAIDTVCHRIDSRRVSHFLYSNNGCGTPGHIRITEAEKMAEELTAYVNSLGDIW